MNQETRNKKNAKYLQNLQKRYGLTKRSEYKNMCNKGISLSEKIKPMLKEFILSKRHGQIISREVYTYKWSREAVETKKDYHNTKNGIPAIPKKPTQQKEEKSKQQKLEERKYSEYHNELIQNLYGSNKAERIAYQQAYKAAHEEKIKTVSKQLQENKMSIKLRNMEQRPYKVVIATKTDSNFHISYSRLPILELVGSMKKLNRKLMKNDNHKSITIIERSTGQKYLFNSETEIKQAA